MCVDYISHVLKKWSFEQVLQLLILMNILVAVVLLKQFVMDQKTFNGLVKLSYESLSITDEI